MKYSKTIAIALCVISLGSPVLAADDVLEAKSVWLPEVEELYKTDVEAPSWLNESSAFVIVRGLAGDGPQSAISVAIRDSILPRLAKQHSAERQVRFRLENSKIIVQRFEQPFYKMVDGERYEAFSREAILIDLSDENMTELTYRTQDAINGTSLLWKNTIGVAVGIVGTLFFACWIACSVLDRLTHGYYVGWLRLMAATTFLVSAGLIVHVARIILQSL